MLRRRCRYYLAGAACGTGPGVGIIAGYGRDHDRSLGAAVYETRLGKGRVLVVLLPELNAVIRQRMLLNALTMMAAPQ